MKRDHDDDMIQYMINEKKLRYPAVAAARH